MRVPQVSFGAGEMSPALWDRSDFSKVQAGARTLRNCVVRPEGGFYGRGGTVYLAEAPGDGVFLPFRYSATQEYVLVFTDTQMRVVKDNGLVLNSYRNASYAWTASSVTGAYYLRTSGFANPNLLPLGPGDVVINGARAEKSTTFPSSLAVGEWGFGNADGLGYNTLYVRVAGSVDPDTLAADYIQAAVVVSTPYVLADLNEINITQSFDTLFLTHRNYAARRLTRTSHTAWTLSTVTFVPSLSAPASLAVDPAATTQGYDYFVAVVDLIGVNPAMKPASTTGLWDAFETADTAAITAMKKTATGRTPWDGTISATFNGVTFPPGTPTKYLLFRKKTADSSWKLMRSMTKTDVVDNDEVSGAMGRASVRAAIGPITGLDVSFIEDESSTVEFKYAVSAEAADESYPSAAVLTTKRTPWTAGTRVTLTWGAIAGAELYNLYKNARGQWGWMGRTDATESRTFSDDNIEPDVSYAPRAAPVYELDTDYPGCTAIFNQRLVFAGMTLAPSRVITSRTGSYLDFSISDPLREDDPVDASPASGRGDPILHMVPADSLVILTEASAWTLNGANGGLKANNPDFKVQGYDGAARSPAPLVFSSSILFVGRSGQVAFDLTYEFASDKYQGNELTVFAPHLFEASTIRRWAYEIKPASVVWTVMADGSFRSLTYVREQDVRAWCRHDTDGLARSVTGINAGTYFFVKRTISGVDRYYIERLSTRAEKIATDSSLSYSGAGTTTLTGLRHLEGKTVSFRGTGPGYDGYGTAVVSGGAITVPNSVTAAVVGLPVVAEFLSLDVNAQGADAKRRLTPRVILRLRNARGISVGSTATSAIYDVQTTDGFDQGYDSATKEFTGDIAVPIDASWVRNPTVYIKQTQPYPFGVVGLVAEVVDGE